MNDGLEEKTGQKEKTKRNVTWVSMEETLKTTMEVISSDFSKDQIMPPVKFVHQTLYFILDTKWTF